MGLGEWLDKSFSQPETGKQTADFAGPNWCKSKLKTGLGYIGYKQYNSEKSKTCN